MVSIASTSFLVAHVLHGFLFNWFVNDGAPHSEPGLIELGNVMKCSGFIKALDFDDNPESTKGSAISTMQKWEP